MVPFFVYNSLARILALFTHFHPCPLMPDCLINAFSFSSSSPPLFSQTKLKSASSLKKHFQPLARTTDQLGQSNLAYFLSIHSIETIWQCCESSNNHSRISSLTLSSLFARYYNPPISPPFFIKLRNPIHS